MLILHNAKILASDSISQVCDAMAILDGKIIAIGKNDEVLSLANRLSSIIDLNGKTILPGLTDSHIHLQHTGKSLSMLNCETNTFQEMYDRLEAKVRATTPGTWIFGHGWNQNLWENGFENFHILNKITNDHPVYLTAKSLHASWASPKALQMAGITSFTKNPGGGVIDRNDDNSPNGLLFENAMGLMDKVIPVLGKHELIKILDLTQQELWKNGITSVHDFDGIDCFAALQEMDQDHRLRLRVVKSIPISNLESTIGIGLQSGFGSDFLRIGSVKLFSDGALGPQTAAMINPYEQDESNFGILLLSKEEIVEYGQKASINGLSLAIHAIGDKANREVIDAFTEIRRFEIENQIPFKNHRIEHVQVLHQADIPRIAKQKIIASMQPIHLISDMDTADRLWGKRSQFAYAFQSLLDAGSQLIFGSDAPVESFNPFLGMYAALTRQKYDQTPRDGWYPQEKMHLQDILKSYTINPAIVSDWNNKIGSLVTGKSADLIVLAKNPYEISPTELKDLSPIATMINGEWVYQREDL